MNIKNPLDYKEYYRSILTINDESSENATKFLQFFSELIVKYNSQIEENSYKGRSE